ncbi:MAG TPA: hypothetical protein VF535_15095 [Allosphingosinicella sp.]|jgi:hypothetical protein
MTASLKTRPSALPVLGALLATLAAAPAAAQYEPPKQMTLSPLGVDLSDGRFSFKATDLSIGPLSLERSFLGGHTIDGSNYFGPNWTHNYAIYVVEKDLAKSNGVYVVLGRGTVHFSFSTFGCWHTDCEGARLTVVNGAFVYTDAQGNVYTFNPSVNAFPPPGNINYRNQRIARIDYADGHTLTYTYSGQQLVQIASNYGYSLVFEYSGSTNSISKACGYNRTVTHVTAASTCAGAALAVSYSYGASGNVTNVVDVMNRNWGYDYGAAAMQLTCVRQVNSTACQIANSYSSGGRPREVSQQTTPDGAVWNYSYSPVDPDYVQLPGQPLPTSGGGYTGPEGIEVDAQFGGGLLDYYGQNGRLTYLQWDGIELSRLYYPEGNNVSYGWRAGQKVSEAWAAKPGSGVATIGKDTGFPDWQSAECVAAQPRKLCNKPLWSKDFRGNQTDFTYELHGGVKTETGPAAGGICPQVRYEYALRRAWVNNGSGYSAESVSIHLPSRKAFCATGAASGWGCAIAGDEVVTTYDYGPDSGPNNLLVRSETVTAGGVSRKTCYGYDWMGNKISTTRPSGACQ